MNNAIPIGIAPKAPLRVLIIANSINPEGRVGIGGAERTAIDLATHINKSLIKPSVLTYEDPGDTLNFLESKGVPVYRLGKRWKVDLSTLNQLHKLISEHRFDAVLSVNTGANFDNLLVTPSFRKTACIIRVPSVRVKFRVMMTEGRIANRADILVVPGTEAEKIITKQYAIPKSRTRLIPNGCDGDHFFTVPYADRFKYRQELGLSDDALILFTPSRLHPIKGQDIFAEALLQIPLSILREKKVVWINTGRIQDEKLAGRIREITSDVSDHVLFLPPITDPEKWYAAADWIIIPSRVESFGLSMLEAAFVGRPIYASRCGVAKEFDSIYNGLTFVPGDVSSALDGLKMILSLDVDERILIAGKLSEYFRKNYSIESTVREYEKTIFEAVNRCQKSS
jgi:glycosyltransferase involved in cell wall biosynthesis